MKLNRFLRGIVILCCVAFILPAVAFSLAAPGYFETEIVTNTADQVNPEISGDNVVWQDYRNKTNGCPSAQNCLGADIYHKDLSTGTEQKLTLTAFAMDPDVDGTNVVWRNWMTGKIVAHDLTAGTEQNTSTLTGYEQMTAPAVSGDIVVWTDYRASSEYGNIYMRDLNQPAEAPVDLASTSPTIPDVMKDKRSPDISGNIVVWEDMRNAFQDASGWWHNPDIYMKDLSTGVVSPVCTDLGDQYYPVISGNKVLWSDYRNGNWDVYMYDIPSGVETRLTDNSFDQNWPDIDGDSVVWKDNRSGSEEIYFGLISTGAETAITADSVSQKLPAIDNGKLIWMDYRNSNWDIFMAEDDTTAPVISAGGPSGSITSSSTTLTASYSDVGTGIDTATVVVNLGGSPVSCSASATDVSCPVGGLADGVHGITVDVSDLAGNAATQWTGSFTVDTTGPVVSSLTADAPPNSGTANISAAYGDIGSGVDVTTVQVSVDGTPLSAGCSISDSSLSCVVTGQTLGSHTADLSLSDTLGNPTASSTSFEVTDTIAPLISNTAPIGLQNTTDATITASFSDNSPSSGVNPASISVTLDTLTVSGCSTSAAGVSCDVDGLADGIHNVAVAVSDMNGNTGNAAWSFSVSTTGPVISELMPAAGGTVQHPNKATISARISDVDGVDGASIRIYFEGADVTSEAVMNGEVISYEAVGIQDGTTYTARVTASDVDGNPSEQEWSFTSVTPQLQLEFVRAYWESHDAWLQRQLNVDYIVTSIGSGACNNAQVPNAVVTNGVIPIGPLPVLMNDLAPNDSFAYSFVYQVPHGVGNFHATSYASCDGDGHTYLFPSLPPQ